LGITLLPIQNNPGFILAKFSRFFLIIFLIILAGCNTFSPTPPSNFEPLQPDPTITPIESAGSPVVPTSVVPIQIAIRQYTHPSNRFQLDYPEHWQYFEQPNSVQLIEPDGQAGYTVIFNEVDRKYNADELNQYLTAFVSQNFAQKETGFSAISQENRPDGTISAQFSSIDANLGPTVTQIQVKQQGSILFVTLVSATEEQWQISAESLQRLTDSLRPLDVMPAAPTAAPTDEPPEWVLIGPTSNLFAFLYPSDWKIVEQNETVVTVTMADYPVSFTGEIFEAIGSAEDAASAFTAELAEKYGAIESLPPADFPLDTTIGITVDFLYTDNGSDMAGSVIVTTHNGNGYRIIFTAPAELYQPGLEWFNPMYKSFKLLSPEN
jgi:hypothetical protein